MRLSLLISLSLLLLSWQRAGAQIAAADDFFHSGAQFYISNNIPQAKDVVDMGLKLYPDDDKLKKLKELLNQQQQQQNQQQQQQQQNQDQQNQQQQQNQQNQSQSQKDQQQQQQQQSKAEQDKQKQDQQKQAQAEQNKQDQAKQDQQQQAKPENADKDKSDKRDEQGQPVAAGQMTPEEAKRLLDSAKNDEQVLQMKPADKPRNTSRPVRDW